jgi:hypothetical protein
MKANIPALYVVAYSAISPWAILPTEGVYPMSKMDVPELIVEMHPSVKRVAEFMQRNIPATELVAVSKALGMIGPSLWGMHGEEIIYPLSLEYPSAETLVEWQDDKSPLDRASL